MVAARYQQVLAEWKACEVVVRQREREAHPATLTKFSSGSSIDSHVQRLVHRDSTISNDVSPTGPGGWGGATSAVGLTSGARGQWGPGAHASTCPCVSFPCTERWDDGLPAARLAYCVLS